MELQEEEEEREKLPPQVIQTELGKTRPADENWKKRRTQNVISMHGTFSFNLKYIFFVMYINLFIYLFIFVPHCIPINKQNLTYGIN